MRAGEQQTSDRRLFMQLLAFGDVADTAPISELLADSGMEGVLYKDVNDPNGIGLLTWSDDPDFFVNILRPFLNRKAFGSLILKPEYTMMGRTYALGHEPNLEDWLFHRPRKTVTDPDWTWHIW